MDKTIAVLNPIAIRSQYLTGKRYSSVNHIVEELEEVISHLEEMLAEKEDEIEELNEQLLSLEIDESDYV